MTLKLILAATDMTPRSDRALARAALTARKTGAALYILHVVDEELPATIAEGEIASAEAALAELTSGSRDFRGLGATVEVLPGDPWKTIVERAEYLGADLLVLGRHRERGLSGMFEGTTIERVAKTSRRPVLRVATPAVKEYHAPIVGVDFSDCARQAARLALDLAPGAPVTLVHGYHVPYRALTMHTGTLGSLSKAEKDQLEAALGMQMASFIAELPSAGREVRTVIAEGAPDRILGEQAGLLKADLLCLGMHARSWLHDSVLGSTARDMLAECRCDLLLAPLPTL